MVRSIPPYYRPVYYHNGEIEAKRQARFKRTYDPTTCAMQATLQGLLAIAWVALGQASLRNGWPFCFALSLGSLQGAVQEHTSAVSRFLMAKKLKKLDKNAI